MFHRGNGSDIDVSSFGLKEGKFEKEIGKEDRVKVSNFRAESIGHGEPEEQMWNDGSIEHIMD